MSSPTTSADGHFVQPPSGSVADFINNTSNTAKEASQTVASIALERGLELAGRARTGTVAGALVQPAVWALSGRAPQPGDIALYGGSLITSIVGGAFGSVATASVGLIKAMVEDHEDGVIQTAIAREPARYRPFISSVRNYDSAGRGIVAMTIASHGGTAWRVGEATWVYLADATGRLVCDYSPAFAHEIYQPVLPLRISQQGRGTTLYQWSARRGNHSG